MKGTIVAQVDSSESFQEFCSTGCLGAYENKQNLPKSGLKTKCTVCGKLTEVSVRQTNTDVTEEYSADQCMSGLLCLSIYVSVPHPCFCQTPFSYVLLFLLTLPFLLK